MSCVKIAWMWSLWARKYSLQLFNYWQLEAFNGPVIIARLLLTEISARRCEHKKCDHSQLLLLLLKEHHFRKSVSVQAVARLFWHFWQKKDAFKPDKGSTSVCVLPPTEQWLVLLSSLFLLFCSCLHFVRFCERLGREHWISIRVWYSCKSEDRKEDALLMSAKGDWCLEADGVQLVPRVHRPALIFL